MSKDKKQEALKMVADGKSRDSVVKHLKIKPQQLAAWIRWNTVKAIKKNEEVLAREEVDEYCGLLKTIKKNQESFGATLGWDQVQYASEPKLLSPVESMQARIDEFKAENESLKAKNERMKDYIVDCVLNGEIEIYD